MGFKTYSPSTNPTLTEAIGPSNGTGENNKAAEARIAASTSGVVTPAYDIVVNIICNSCL